MFTHLRTHTPTPQSDDIKINHRKRYIKKQKSDTPKNDDELELLGDQEIESFLGSHADLESAADHLFTSPSRPQPLAFEALSLKTPAISFPPTPGTALQQKIESKFEQSLGSHLDIQLEQKMSIFQANKAAKRGYEKACEY